MKTHLLVSFATLAYAASENKDVPIEKCAVSIDGVKRPSVLPSLCKNTYADIPCAHLYPVTDNSSHHNESENFLLSGRCYAGQLQPYAYLCSRQCALCCNEPQFNCTDKLSKANCQLFSAFNLCGNSHLYDFLNINCRQSCGLCKEPQFNGTFCSNLFGHCDQLFGLVPCSNRYMQKNCKGTCMISKDCECKDTLPLCVILAERPEACNDDEAKAICPLTCGACSVSTMGPVSTKTSSTKAS